MYSLCSGGGAQPIIKPKSSGRTFDKLYDIRKYAHPDFLAVQCNLGGRSIERVRYLTLLIILLLIDKHPPHLPFHVYIKS